jgi:hypothetical protein
MILLIGTSGSLDNCPDDRASVSVLHLAALPIGGSSKLHRSTFCARTVCYTVLTIEARLHRFAQNQRVSSNTRARILVKLFLQIATFSESRRADSNRFLLVTSDRSGVAGGCRSLQIPHI